MSLYPTKTRLGLLREVRDGNVWHQADNRAYVEPSGVKVHQRMLELNHAGWVELPETTERVPRRWVLTDAGRAVLDA